MKFDEPLPAGWALTHCSDFCSGRNETFNPAKGGDEEFVLYSVPSHETGKPEIVRASEIGSNKQFVSAGDTLISKINPRLNRTWVVGRHPGKQIIASTEWIVFGRSPAFIPQFLAYFLQQGVVRDFLSHNASGVGGSLTRVRASIFEQMPLPLPPLAEQKRIVAKIEELFSELDAGEESLRVARRQLGVYRQSLLKQAFEGKLTENWRTQNPAKLESPAALIDAIQERSRSARFKANDHHRIPGWCYCTLDELTESVTSGSRGWADYYAESGSIFIRAQNLNQDFLNLADIAYVQLPESAEGKRTRVKYGDLLITITGANTTKAGWVSTQLDEAYVSQHVALCRPVSESLSPFLYRYIIADAGGRKKLTADAYGAGKPGLNLDNVRSLGVPLPPLPEQHEIVRLLDAQFEVIEQNEREIDAALQRSEALRQAILKKAFTGRLVAQDPADEPVSAFLARLRAERDSSNTKPSRPALVAKPVTPPPASADDLFPEVVSFKPLGKTDLQAGIVALALDRFSQRGQFFGHTIAEKVVHLADHLADLQLDRHPVKDAAGPNDFRRAKEIEHRARMKGWFTVSHDGPVYHYHAGRNLPALLDATQRMLGTKLSVIESLLEKLRGLDTREIEVIATVYAAWNNLILAKASLAEEAIVTEARERWHARKLEIPRDRFFRAIAWMKNNNFVPNGTGRPVRSVEQRFTPCSREPV